MRRFAHAGIACLAGAGLALYGATRVWAVAVTPRPGLSDLRESSTGAEVQPWLIALALIALAGPGALFATRGTLRRVLGGLIAATGLGVAVAAVAGRLAVDPGAAGAGATVWPIVCVLGGALVALAGVGAARHGHEWPAMISRYERRAVPPPGAGRGAGSGPSPAAGRSDGPDAEGALSRTDGPDAAEATRAEAAGRHSDAPHAAGTTGRRSGGPDAGRSGGADGGASRAEPAPVDTRAVWDALDRGDDPTR